jgi:hypothetical protein
LSKDICDIEQWYKGLFRGHKTHYSCVESSKSSFKNIKERDILKLIQKL